MFGSPEFRLRALSKMYIPEALTIGREGRHCGDRRAIVVRWVRESTTQSRAQSLRWTRTNNQLAVVIFAPLASLTRLLKRFRARPQRASVLAPCTMSWH